MGQSESEDGQVGQGCKAEPDIAPRPGPHSFFRPTLRHWAVPAGELLRSATGGLPVESFPPKQVNDNAGRVFCPAFDRVIDDGLCWECCMADHGGPTFQRRRLQMTTKRGLVIQRGNG